MALVRDGMTRSNNCMGRPLVSVVTVCRNAEATISAAVQSVARQDWPLIDHVIVDGASSDRTLEEIERHSLPEARVISEPDAGIYDAMNKGLALVRGDIVCFLNADDRYVRPDVFTTVVTAMGATENVAVMGDVGFERAGRRGHVIRRYRSRRFSPDRLAWGWMPAHPGCFLSRDIVERVGRFDASFKIAGDYEYLVRVFRRGGVRQVFLDEMLVYMTHGGVSTGGLRAAFRLNKEVIRACRQNRVYTNWAMVLTKYPLKFRDCW